MIYNYPYVHYPSYAPYPYSPYYRNAIPQSKVPSREEPRKTVYQKEEKRKIVSKPLCEKDEEKEAPFFSILGIDLYFDDILILCLLFFLYNEGVKDQYLFISLILLLLT